MSKLRPVRTESVKGVNHVTQSVAVPAEPAPPGSAVAAVEEEAEKISGSAALAAGVARAAGQLYTFAYQTYRT